MAYRHVFELNCAFYVLQEKGTCDKDFWIDVLLTILGYLPGVRSSAPACKISHAPCVVITKMYSRTVGTCCWDNDCGLTLGCVAVGQIIYAIWIIGEHPFSDEMAKADGHSCNFDAGHCYNARAAQKLAVCAMQCDSEVAPRHRRNGSQQLRIQLTKLAEMAA